MSNDYENAYKDILYFKSLYPVSIYPIAYAVSEYCDRLEYSGSIMYDEYPDKERIRQISRSITQSLADSYQSSSQSDFRLLTNELVEVLLLNEFIHRRIRRKAYS